MSKFKIITWKPKKHLRYWVYTLFLWLPFGKKWKRHWFIKRCNFINKPLFDVLIKSKPYPENYWPKVSKELSQEDFSWKEVNKSNMKESDNPFFIAEDGKSFNRTVTGKCLSNA